MKKSLIFFLSFTIIFFALDKTINFYENNSQATTLLDQLFGFFSFISGIITILIFTIVFIKSEKMLNRRLDKSSLWLTLLSILFLVAISIINRLCQLNIDIPVAFFIIPILLSYTGLIFSVKWLFRHTNDNTSTNALAIIGLILNLCFTILYTMLFFIVVALSVFT